MSAIIRCNICGDETIMAFSARDYRRPFDKTEYSLRWCSECALGRIAGTFSPEDVSKFFDIPYYTREPNQMSGPEYRTFLDRLIIHLAWRVDRGVDLTPDELGPANNRTLCDLGCGNGRNLKRFSDAGFKVVGLEPDRVARAIADQIAPVFDGTMETLPAEISSRRFDVVLLSHVFDVCIDLQKSLSNIRSILSPTGMLVVEVPNFAAKGFKVYGAEWPWTDIPRHLTFFTEKSLRRTLEASGFSVKRAVYVGYNRQFSASWREAQMAIRREIGSDNSRSIPSWLWLVRTAFSSAAEKYDSVRVHATPVSN